MLADAKFVVPPRGYSGLGSRDRSWTDDNKQPWNKQAHQPSMVSHLHHHIPILYRGMWPCASFRSLHRKAVDLMNLADHQEDVCTDIC
jgi:hypothetical protein